MASSSNPKPRQPRLRASCDGCFLAKVKCSKTRPMCSRCLTCGIECRYSPSSRIGKPRTDQGGAPPAAAAASSSSSSSSLSPSSSQYLHHHHQQQHHHQHQLHNHHHHNHQKHELDLSCLSPLVDASCGSGGAGGDFIMFSPISPLSPVTPDLMMGAGDGAGWASSSSPIAVVDRNHQAAMAMLGMDGSSGAGVGGIMGEVGADFYAAWTRPSDMTAVGADSPLSNTTTTTSSPIHPAVPLHRGLSMDSIMAASAGGLVTSSSPPPPLPAWTDAVADMMGGYHPAAAGHGCYFASSPSAGSPDPGPVLTPTPAQAQAPALIRSRTASSPPHQQGILCPSSSSSSSSSCVCFGACLQLLQTLHEIVSPPVELVLRLSAKAIEGCTSMLACPKCLGHQDRGTAAMMLAAVIVKLTKFYHDAAVDSSGGHGDAAAGTGLGIVTNSGGGGGWPELDFLAREMARLQDLFRQFNDACGGSGSMPEVAATALPGGMDIGRSVAELVGQNLSVNMAAVSHKMRSSSHRLQQVHYSNHNHHGHARGGSSGYGGAGRLGRE